MHRRVAQQTLSRPNCTHVGARMQSGPAIVPGSAVELSVVKMRKQQLEQIKLCKMFGARVKIAVGGGVRVVRVGGREGQFG